MSRAKVSAALFSTLGFSELDVVDAVVLLFKKTQGSRKDFQRSLELECGFSSNDAAQVAGALFDPDATASRSSSTYHVEKRARVDDTSNLDVSTKPAEEASLRDSSDPLFQRSEPPAASAGVFNDPMLAAKAGRFEEMKEDPFYMAQLREEVRSGVEIFCLA